ncbi:MAG: OmpA family protein [Cytophagales bacterium]|nr:OmpA family protein [Cytophagales bacterium]
MKNIKSLYTLCPANWRGHALCTMRLFTTGLALIVFTNAYAQNIKKIMQKADYFFEESDYKAAIPLYLEALELDPQGVNKYYKKTFAGVATTQYRLGLCYLQTTFKTKSIPHLKKAFKMNPLVHAEVQYHLGLAYQLNHRFDEAIASFRSFKGTLSEKEQIKIQELNRKILECKNGIEMVKNPVKAKLDNLGPVVNSKYNDFAPVISADESILMFTSRRPGSIGGDQDEFGEHYEDIYTSYNIDGNWTEPRNMGKPINTNDHDATIALSPDGKRLFIYNSDNGGDIFYSELKGDIWSKPQGFGKNINSKNTEPSVSMTSDHKTIYFSSNKPGGYGGLDIYMSKLDAKGKWGQAINLGPVINTKYDDDAPFIQVNGRDLYFSSRGLKGMGDYDIYRSTLKGGVWSEPENLGYPINTAGADIYFVLSADNKHGYYASDKEDGIGAKDIYMISMPERKKIAAVTTKRKTIKTNPKKKIIAPVKKVKTVTAITILKGTIRDDFTKKPLDAKVVVIDNAKNQTIFQETADPLTGKYQVDLPSGKNYGIRAEKKDYMFHSENVNIPASEGFQEITKDIYLKKIAIGTKVVLKNIFFDLGKANLRPESGAELVKLATLLQENPTIKIEISGHTDNASSWAYNKKLSENRAKSVVDYLRFEGIEEWRLRYAGYSFDKPIASNDTKAGRQLNRRVEFEIIGN